MGSVRGGGGKVWRNVRGELSGECLGGELSRRMVGRKGLREITGENNPSECPDRHARLEVYVQR